MKIIKGKMKSKIHTHKWIDSVNVTCPFCSKDTKYCTDVKCYLYKCTNMNCNRVFSIKKEYNT